MKNVWLELYKAKKTYPHGTLVVTPNNENGIVTDHIITPSGIVLEIFVSFNRTGWYYVHEINEILGRN
jgi:hypothetical protein